MQVLTGDNLAVAKQCCQALHIPTEYCITGSDLAQLEDAELDIACDRNTVFAKVLDPNPVSFPFCSFPCPENQR